MYYPGRASGAALGPTMPMWRVQTECQSDGTGLPWGVVSTGPGFEDSPDAEMICGGANTKGVDSVAIGRHGNFLEWGFAVSPEHMTEHAKLAFINAVHYISRFDGQRPLVRNTQFSYRREWLRDTAYQLSPAGVEANAAIVEVANARMRERQAQLRDRLASGAELSQIQQRVLSQTPLSLPARGEGLWGLPDGVRDSFGEDLDGLQAWCEANLPYIRSAENYTFEVDADARAMGIANDDVA
ncbi:MAG: hypothetical protein ACYTGR_01635, partial [Planctomycetota bacterium]